MDNNLRKITFHRNEHRQIIHHLHNPFQGMHVNTSPTFFNASNNSTTSVFWVHKERSQAWPSKEGQGVGVFARGKGYLKAERAGYKTNGVRGQALIRFSLKRTFPNGYIPIFCGKTSYRPRSLMSHASPHQLAQFLRCPINLFIIESYCYKRFPRPLPIPAGPVIITPSQVAYYLFCRPFFYLFLRPSVQRSSWLTRRN